MKAKRNYARIILVTLIMLLVMSFGANAASISKKSAKITKGSSFTLKVKGTKKSAKWKTSRKSVATVSKKGVVKGVSAGTATITATIGKKKYSCKVTVTNPAKKASKKASKVSGTAAAKTVTKTTTTKKTTTKTTTKKTTKSSAKSALALDGSTAGLSPAEAAAYKKILAMKSRYPEGMRWTNANYYEWNGGIYRGGYGCAGFAFAMSDAAFGDAPARRHTNFNDLHTGDIVRYLNNTHMVVVMKVVGNQVVIAEGNYNSSIHWGDVISLSEIKKTGTYVLTRY